jgi:hypothetical protein
MVLFTIDLDCVTSYGTVYNGSVKYVSNIRQEQHSKQLGLCWWSSEWKGNRVPVLDVVDSFWGTVVYQCPSRT